VEGSHAVAGLELGGVGADLFHYAGDIISLVDLFARPLWHLPVLRVAPANDYLDKHFIRVRLRDGRVHDSDVWAWASWSITQDITEILVRRKGVAISESVPELTMASFMVMGRGYCVLLLLVSRLDCYNESEACTE